MIEPPWNPRGTLVEPWSNSVTMDWFPELLQRPPLTWRDGLDILIVSVLVYELLKLIRGTRAVQMAVAIALIVGLFYRSREFQLQSLNWLIRNIVGYVVFAAIVLMQADIRRALMHIGRAPHIRRLERAQHDEDVVEELVVAASTLAARHIGALIVIERGLLVCGTTSKAASRSMRGSPTTFSSASFSTRWLACPRFRRRWRSSVPRTH